MRFALLIAAFVSLALPVGAEGAEVSVFPVSAKGRGKRAPRKQAKTFQANLLAAIAETGHTTKLVAGKKLVRKAARCRGKARKRCLGKLAKGVGGHVLVAQVSKARRKVVVGVHVFADGKHVGAVGGKLGSGVAAKAAALLPKVEPPAEEVAEEVEEEAPAEEAAAEAAPAEAAAPAAAPAAPAEATPAEAAPAAPAEAAPAAPAVAAAPAGKSNTMAYVFMGTGVALIGGAYAGFGMRAQELHKELSEGIPEGTEYDEKSAEFLQARNMADIVGFTGGAVIAYGVYRLVAK